MCNNIISGYKEVFNSREKRKTGGGNNIISKSVSSPIDTEEILNTLRFNNNL